MTRVTAVTEREMVKAITNCYPSKIDKLAAMVYYRRNGQFPFNPQLN